MQKTKKSNWVVVIVFSVLAFLFLVNDVISKDLKKEDFKISVQKSKR